MKTTTWTQLGKPFALDCDEALRNLAGSQLWKQGSLVLKGTVHER